MSNNEHKEFTYSPTLENTVLTGYQKRLMVEAINHISEYKAVQEKLDVLSFGACGWCV